MKPLNAEQRKKKRKQQESEIPQVEKPIEDQLDWVYYKKLLKERSLKNKKFQKNNKLHSYVSSHREAIEQAKQTHSQMYQNSIEDRGLLPK